MFSKKKRAEDIRLSLQDIDPSSTSTDVTGQITAFTSDDGSNVEMVMPGDRIKMTGELICPVAIEQGMRFAIREGGRTIGAGVVSKILK